MDDNHDEFYESETEKFWLDIAEQDKFARQNKTRYNPEQKRRREKEKSWVRNNPR